MTRHATHLFYDASEASRAVDALMAEGVERNDISILMTEAGAGKHFALRESTKAPEGAAAGGAIGGAIGLLAGAVVTAATAGVGILATGPILVGLAGLGTGALVGGITGALTGLGIPENEARIYEREMQEQNAILIGVDCQRYDQDKIDSVFDRFHTRSSQTV